MNKDWTLFDESFCQSPYPTRAENINSYEFRNYPISCTTDDKLCCIIGDFVDTHSTSMGILEWCISIDDARNLMDKMVLDPRFFNLSAQRYRCESVE